MAIPDSRGKSPFGNLRGLTGRTATPTPIRMIAPVTRAIGSLLVSLCLWAVGLPAQAYDATEDFTYAPSQPLAGLNGGTGWLDAWSGSGTAEIASPSLDFPGQSESGNKAVLPTNGSTYTLFRQLSQTVDGTSFSSASFSFLFNLTGIDFVTGIRFAGLSFFSGATELIYFGKPGNTTDIGIHKYSGGETIYGVSTSFSGATVFFFQANFSLSSGGNSTVSVTLSNNTGPSGTQIANWDNLDLGTGFSFDRIRLIRDTALSGAVNPEFDEIQLSAIPEPSTVGLGTLALAAALAVGRRRKTR